MGYVLPSFDFFSVYIAISLGRNARITPLLADNMHSKNILKIQQS